MSSRPSWMLWMVIATLLASCPFSRARATETATEWLENLNLECRAASVNHEVAPAAAGVTVTVPACFCAETAAELQAWLAAETKKWQASEMQMLGGLPSYWQAIDLEPGEKKEVSIYCFTPAQIDAYRLAFQTSKKKAPEPGG